MMLRAILISALGFFAASAAAHACGTNTGSNMGPLGSYTATCSTYMEFEGVVYALCPPAGGGCSTTFSVLPLDGFSCGTVHNINGVLECGAASIPASFTESSDCSWYMTSGGSFEINCGSSPDPTVFQLPQVITDCPNGIINEKGVVTCG